VAIFFWYAIRVLLIHRKWNDSHSTAVFFLPPSLSFFFSSISARARAYLPAYRASIIRKDTPLIVPQLSSSFELALQRHSIAYLSPGDREREGGREGWTIEIRRARTCQPRFSASLALALAKGKKQRTRTYIHTCARTLGKIA